MNHPPYPVLRDPLRARRTMIAAAVASACLGLSTHSPVATAQTPGPGSLGIGNGAVAAGADSTAIGNGARVVPSTDSGSIAFGLGASVALNGSNGATTSGNIAFGTSASVGVADNAIAIGTGASSERSNGIAIGTGTHNSFAGIAIGANSSTGYDGQIAIGLGAIADPSAGTGGGVAIGQGSYTGGNGAALGLNAYASGQAVAVGPNAYTGYRAIAVGQNATATADGSVAVGINSLATATNSTAIGFSANAAGTGSLVFGNGAHTNVDGLNAVAIGTGALSERSDGVALGTSAHTGFTGVAIGAQTYTDANGGIAIGTGAIARGYSNASPNGMAIGAGASAGGSGMALGAGASAAENYAIAIGQASYAKTGDLALGINATATAANSVAIGASSSDGGRQNVVSMGAPGHTRTVTNVTAGTQATDAANVGQLPGTISGNVVTMGNPLAPNAVAGAVTVTNVAAGTLSASSNDVVNGAQLFATNQSVTNTSTAISNLSNGINAGTVGLVRQTGGAPGNGPISVGALTGGASVNFSGTSGARTLSGVAAGTATTDAVNVGQLNTVAGAASNSVQYDNAGHTSVTLGGTGAAAPVALTNVADAALSAASTDAVNGGQLFATNQAVANASSSITNLTNGINTGTAGLVQQTGSAPGNGPITVGAQTSGTSVDFTGTAGARTLSGVAAGTAATDAVNVSQLTAVAGTASNSVKYDNAGHTAVTLGGTSAAAPVALTNVAAGALSASSDDAVNGSQLFTTNQAVANSSTVVTTLSTSINAGTVGLVQQTGGAPGNGLITVGAQSGGTSVDFTGTAGSRTLSGVAAGTATTDAANVGQLNTVAGVALNSVQYDNAGHTSVTLGGTSATAPVELTNVAVGTLSASSTDAVNGGQLFTTNQAVANASSSITSLTTSINAGTVGLVQQTGGAPGNGPITVGAQTAGTTVDFTGTAGARTLSGVAAGTVATDAVNVGQLNAVADTATNSVQYDNAGHTSVTLGGSAAAASIALTNVAAGALSASSSDAVNGGQLFTTNQAVANASSSITSLTTSINAGTVGLVQQTGGAPGNGPITVGAQTAGTSVDFTGTAGARTLSGVAAGTATTDAVNVGQLNAVAGTASNSVQYDNASHTSVTLGGARATAAVALTNVAAGALSASSTDAVNGGQLFATSQAVANLSAGINAGTVGLVQQTGGAPGNGPITVGAQTDGTTVDFAGTGGARTLSGVAAGSAATDAVNVSQLTAVAGTAWNSVQYDNTGHTSVTLGGTAAAAPVALTNVAAGALSVTSSDAVNGAQLFATNQAVANTSTSVTNLATSINAGTVGLVQQTGGAPGNGPITVGALTGGASVNFAGTTGARTLSGVAAGTATTDAVNVGQLNTVAGAASNSVQYDNAGHTSVTLGGTGAAAPVALANVAAGALSAASTDAVNGAQLYATNQALAGTTATVNTLSTGIATGTIGLVQQLGGAPGTGTITIGAATGGTTVDFSGTSGARQLKGVAAGTDGTDAVNVSQLNATVSSATANAVVYDSAARSIITLGGIGATVPVTLRNVAAGVLAGTSTDAVNGSQLYATNQAVAANTGAIDALSNSLTDVQRNMAKNTAQLQPIVSADALKYFAASSTGAPASASGAETVAAGGNSLAAGTNSVAIGTGAQAIGSGALAIGANTSAKGSNSIALGQGSAVAADNTVSIGNSAMGLTRTLANVSAGVAPTDAVNVQQLNDSVTGVRSQVEHDHADANGGTASAVAIASLPQAPAPGRSVVSIGGGTYAGQSAVAVGMSTYAGRWILKASGSTNTRGTVAAGAGAAYVW
ncbi:YadA-like family protein [Burkholderia cepacia]|uniref:YadA-like family protein n=1 Tax=Burkholderia cepacia TaxID=292 RepID=UPI001CF4683B|nr:YadA-like family protein [Burkholderia cepacia]MCA7981327.1 YadA-like family protein [Burkholderia cepacia]